MTIRKDLIESHIATHTEKSAEDQAAVNVLSYFLTMEGRINADFASVDKWPNHDGTFEFVPNPHQTRIPEQTFYVQIKGTCIYNERDGVISYSLKSLAFPAFIAGHVTADPGILFVVLNPGQTGRERIFWKYMSPSFLRGIDFSNGSMTIKFKASEEIKNTDESKDAFCRKLQSIVDRHVFLAKLDERDLKKDDALRIIRTRCDDISLEIDGMAQADISRDSISRRIINGLYDLCYACLILNAFKCGYSTVDVGSAWEIAQFNAQTRYMSDFLKGLKYLGVRIPEDGQSERLMLKYYNYLWEIRRFLKQEFNINILYNLERFPLNTDSTDMEYYEKVVGCMAVSDLSPRAMTTDCYDIQKKVPFYINGERYFEITLQLAGLYATKFNRITVYTKEDILTDYSIQIAYIRGNIDLWGVSNPIKIITNWKVAIPARCLNKLAKILNKDIKLNRKYGEYISLMNFLTNTGMNLFDFINLREERFWYELKNIYKDNNTSFFKDILIMLRRRFSLGKNVEGKYTIRYILLNLREDVLEAVFPSNSESKTIGDLQLSSKCYPFEKNPLVSNLAGKKTSRSSMRNLLEILDESEPIKIAAVYKNLENDMYGTGELYFKVEDESELKKISRYNNSLDSWEKRQGYEINVNNGFASIKSYEESTLFILEKLKGREFTRHDEKQLSANRKYLRTCGFSFEDPQKKIALKYLFTRSNVVLIYGAAGSGKTTLMDYITDMLSNLKKLYLTKTHTALQNLKRRITHAEDGDSFEGIDSFIRRTVIKDYDIIFVDECSTIDNRTMKVLLEKVGDDSKLVLAGDIYQIESIEFGNWFYYAKEIITTAGVNIELLNIWRTEMEELKSLWNSVRTMDGLTTEKLVMDGPFSSEIGENILESTSDDEVILCLNYDGKFGLNNMNTYFQNANPNEAYTWSEWSFKVGDPIIFLDSKRFTVLYNNLRGKIIGIEAEDNYISFTLDVYTTLSEAQCRCEDFEFIGPVDDGSRIRIELFRTEDDDATDEERMRAIVPFQVAYAVSIHKAQGLEYDSVKIIIPSYNAERISHSIFYTAITRAKKQLRIFWSSETMEGVIENFENEVGKSVSLSIIREKLGDLC